MAALDTEDQPFDRGAMTSLSSFPPVQLSLILRFSNQRSPFLLITPSHYPHRFLVMCSDLVLVSGHCVKLIHDIWQLSALLLAAHTVSS